jgi:hypothetical protein
MIELGQARECEVILAFLTAEAESPGYSETIRSLLEQIGVSREKLIDDPNLDSDCCNALRGIVLDGYRGYMRRRNLFLGFPKPVDWRRVQLEPDDFNRLRYVAKEPSWEKCSQGTRLPQRVVERIARGELPDLQKKIAGIQENLRRGKLFPEIIAAEGEKGDLILIEGHSRATAYVGLGWNTNIAAFLASSPFMHRWYFY